MRMTDEQIRETVAGMDMSQALKDTLLKQAITDNNPGARFVIHARARRVAPTACSVTILRKTFRAATLATLRADVRTWIEAREYGASRVGSRWAVSGHARVTEMSYNGRFWDGDGVEVTEVN